MSDSTTEHQCFRTHHVHLEWVVRHTSGSGLSGVTGGFFLRWHLGLPLTLPGLSTPAGCWRMRS
ncbi:hypothetical protein GCM10009576_099050 [Streptomyces rhizosphaericus]|uniref:Uncharacterized protein n=1 Tax=Streptomyces rhizosphaericus TaxID=114699 RepID=A0ABN1TAL1_9ACTN